MADLPVRPEKEVEVGGETFKLRKYSTTKGIKFEKYLIKIAGPAYIESQKSEDVTLADVLAKVLENLDEIDENVIKDMVASAVIYPEMSPQKYETHFSGKSVLLFKLLKEIIFYNFEDVFTLLGLGEIPEE